MSVILDEQPRRRAPGFDLVIGLERPRFKRQPARLAPPLAATAGDDGPFDLAIDLVGSTLPIAAPRLTLDYSGEPDLPDGVAVILAKNQLPELIARIDGVPVARARPMLSDRLWLSQATTELAAAAISLIELVLARQAASRLTPLADAVPQVGQGGRAFLLPYLPHFVTAFASRVRRRLRSHRFDWRVGYRLGTDTRFTELTSTPDGFYADPFVFEWRGRRYVFVEDYRHALGKGIIGVSEDDGAGRLGPVRPVLETAFHLSYPQVFAEGDEVFMLPEGSAGGDLVLYRATAFPDRWEVDTVFEGLDGLGDATLLRRDGRYWLFATQRRGYGSPSDTMVVFSADALRGPYRPHRLNPILIDRAAARPGGQFIEVDGRTFLPVQDGTLMYGGGLGLAELELLSDDEVRFAPPRPYTPQGIPAAGIHTLNRAGPFEVVDWFV